MKVRVVFTEHDYDWYFTRLEGVEARGERDVMARCPAHDDNRPSLHVVEDEQGLLVHCFAGCARADIDDALEDVAPGTRDLIAVRQRRERGTVIATYDYRNAEGELIYRKLRMEPKSFEFRRPVIVPARTQGPIQHSEYVRWHPGLKDLAGNYVVEPEPYNLPEVIDAVKRDDPVFLVDGEKDCDRLAEEGVAATCSPYGMARWRADWNEYLRGAVVFVVADRDEPGRRAAAKVVEGLGGVAASAQVIRAAHGKDAFDHLEAGFTLNDFEGVTDADD